VRTDFQVVARRLGAQSQTGSRFFFVSVKQVVREALATLQADRPLVIPGFTMKFAMFVTRVTPMPVLRLLLRLSPGRG
jgi:short-subunit dehydrogenase